MFCSSEKSALRAITVFATLYMLSGAFITSVGIYALAHLPELFTTGSVIWSGIIVAGLGAMAMIFACCGPASFRKSMVLFALAIVILVVCIMNIVLLETVEWKYGIAPVPSNDPEQEERRDFLFFLTCLFSLFGTVLGLVTAVCNLIYAYCILLIPMKRLEKKRDILKERVKLHHSIRVASPRARGIPDGKTRSKHPTGTVESPSELPRTKTSKVHDWVYNNNDISSDLSMSSQGTEMTANRAFLKTSLNTNTPTSPETSGHDPFPHASPPSTFVTTRSKKKKQKRGEKTKGTPYQPRKNSIVGIDAATFRVDRQNDKNKNQTTSSKGRDVAGMPQERRNKSSFRPVLPSEDSPGDLEDVHTAFSKLDKALNVSATSDRDTTVTVISNHFKMDSSQDSSSQRLESSSSSRGDASSSWLEISSPGLDRLDESSMLNTNSSGQNTSESKMEDESRMEDDVTFRMDEIDGRLLAQRPPAPTESPPPPPPSPPQQHRPQQAPPPPPPPQQSPSAKEDTNDSWVEITSPKMELTTRLEADGSREDTTAPQPPMPPPVPPLQPPDNYQASNIAIEELMTQMASTKL